jgi:uncharacterized protein
VIDYLKDFWQSNRNTSPKSNIYIGFYGGEPLMNMDFVTKVVEYIENLQNSNRSFSFSMTTNGILIDKYADYLAEKQFNLLVSLDGDKENNLYRVDKAGNSHFDKIVANIYLLREKYPQYFLDKVNFNAVLHNKNSAESIYSFIKNEFNKIPAITSLNNMGIKPEKLPEFENTFKDVEESIYASSNPEAMQKDMFIKSPTYQEVCTFIHQYGGSTFRNYRDLLFKKAENNTWITGTCPPFGKKMFVTVNGKILPCERIGHQFSLGHIDEHNEVFLNFDEICEKYNAYFSKLEGQCTACFGKKSCTQCIFNIPSLEEENAVCHGFMDKTSFNNYASRNLFFLSQNPEEYYRIMEEVIVE